MTSAAEKEEKWKRVKEVVNAAVIRAEETNISVTPKHIKEEVSKDATLQPLVDSTEDGNIFQFLDIVTECTRKRKRKPEDQGKCTHKWWRGNAPRSLAVQIQGQKNVEYKMSREELRCPTRAAGYHMSPFTTDFLMRVGKNKDGQPLLKKVEVQVDMSYVVEGSWAWKTSNDPNEKIDWEAN
eukprot:GEMP01047101.1.p1 GENE.GEMP01047101.1~~GEMP01047101.1.p1  ORF type:complete len:182 (+),score=40.76 GEMP01047101.1:33-578(+)